MRKPSPADGNVRDRAGQRTDDAIASSRRRLDRQRFGRVEPGPGIRSSVGFGSNGRRPERWWRSNRGGRAAGADFRQVEPKPRSPGHVAVFRDCDRAAPSGRDGGSAQVLECREPRQDEKETGERAENGNSSPIRPEPVTLGLLRAAERRTRRRQLYPARDGIRRRRAVRPSTGSTSTERRSDDEPCSRGAYFFAVQRRGSLYSAAERTELSSHDRQALGVRTTGETMGVGIENAVYWPTAPPSQSPRNAGSPIPFPARTLI
jgi:hypothetical protein